MTRRRDPRVAIQLDVFVRLQSWDIARRLETVDVSCGGVALWSPAPARDGESVRVTFALPDGSSLRLKGDVRHCNATADRESAGWRIGVRLQMSAPRVRDAFEEMVRWAKLRPISDR